MKISLILFTLLSLNLMAEEYLMLKESSYSDSCHSEADLLRIAKKDIYCSDGYISNNYSNDRFTIVKEEAYSDKVIRVKLCLSRMEIRCKEYIPDPCNGYCDGRWSW